MDDLAKYRAQALNSAYAQYKKAFEKEHFKVEDSDFAGVKGQIGQKLSAMDAMQITAYLEKLRQAPSAQLASEVVQMINKDEGRSFAPRTSDDNHSVRQVQQRNFVHGTGGGRWVNAPRERN